MSSVQQVGELKYGCIFCKTGSEKVLIQELTKNVRCAEFLVAQKKSRRHIRGKMIEENVILFPGYVFFRTTEDLDFDMLRCLPSVLKVLTYGDGRWQLVGDDYHFVDWLFSQKGIIGFSKALALGNKLRIIEGPLMSYEGQIIKINRRFQNCLVLLKFKDRELKVWLGYEMA